MTINVCLPYPSYSYICFSAIYVHESVMQESISKIVRLFFVPFTGKTSAPEMKKKYFEMKIYAVHAVVCVCKCKLKVKDARFEICIMVLTVWLLTKKCRRHKANKTKRALFFFIHSSER